ncbi:MAG: MxaA protein [Gammaproteobacteria bacterium]|nr:MxaA protein [Gammaproteobacteria bacterium]
MRAAVVSGLACALMSLETHARDIDVEVVNPRTFGYVIGDTFNRQINVNGSPGLALDKRSLPRLGRQSAWLTLISADVQTRRHAGAGDVVVRLRYQIRNAPTHIRTIRAPSFDLRFTDSSQATDASIDSLPVIVSPLFPTDLSAEATPLRPDRMPQRLSVNAPLVRILVYVALAVAILAYLFVVPRILHRRGPFTQAYRVIRRAAAAHDPGAYRRALRAVHRAFDQTAGRRVFADHMNAFIAEKPQFADLREATARFLHISQREFFADGTPVAEQEFDWLLRFCHDCRARERRRA